MLFRRVHRVRSRSAATVAVAATEVWTVSSRCCSTNTTSSHGQAGRMNATSTATNKSNTNGHRSRSGSPPASGQNAPIYRGTGTMKLRGERRQTVTNINSRDREDRHYSSNNKRNGQSVSAESATTSMTNEGPSPITSSSPSSSSFTFTYEEDDELKGDTIKLAVASRQVDVSKKRRKSSRPVGFSLLEAVEVQNPVANDKTPVATTTAAAPAAAKVSDIIQQLSTSSASGGGGHASNVDVDADKVKASTTVTPKANRMAELAARSRIQQQKLVSRLNKSTTSTTSTSGAHRVDERSSCQQAATITRQKQEGKKGQDAESTSPSTLLSSSQNSKKSSLLWSEEDFKSAQTTVLESSNWQDAAAVTSSLVQRYMDYHTQSTERQRRWAAKSATYGISSAGVRRASSAPPSTTPPVSDSATNSSSSSSTNLLNVAKNDMFSYRRTLCKDELLHLMEACIVRTANANKTAAKELLDQFVNASNQVQPDVIGTGWDDASFKGHSEGYLKMKNAKHHKDGERWKNCGRGSSSSSSSSHHARHRRDSAKTAPKKNLLFSQDDEVYYHLVINNKNWEGSLSLVSKKLQYANDIVVKHSGRSSSVPKPQELISGKSVEVLLDTLGNNSPHPTLALAIYRNMSSGTEKWWNKKQEAATWETPFERSKSHHLLSKEAAEFFRTMKKSERCSNAVLSAVNNQHTATSRQWHGRRQQEPLSTPATTSTTMESMPWRESLFMAQQMRYMTHDIDLFALTNVMIALHGVQKNVEMIRIFLENCSTGWWRLYVEAEQQAVEARTASLELTLLEQFGILLRRIKKENASGVDRSSRPKLRRHEAICTSLKERLRESPQFRKRLLGIKNKVEERQEDVLGNLDAKLSIKSRHRRTEQEHTQVVTPDGLASHNAQDSQLELERKKRAEIREYLTCSSLFGRRNKYSWEYRRKIPRVPLIPNEKATALFFSALCNIRQHDVVCWLLSPSVLEGAKLSEAAKQQKGRVLLNEEPLLIDVERHAVNGFLGLYATRVAIRACAQATNGELALQLADFVQERHLYGFWRAHYTKKSGAEVDQLVRSLVEEARAVHRNSCRNQTLHGEAQQQDLWEQNNMRLEKKQPTQSAVPPPLLQRRTPHFLKFEQYVRENNWKNALFVLPRIGGLEGLAMEVQQQHDEEHNEDTFVKASLFHLLLLSVAEANPSHPIVEPLRKKCAYMDFVEQTKADEKERAHLHQLKNEKMALRKQMVQKEWQQQQQQQQPKMENVEVVLDRLNTILEAPDDDLLPAANTAAQSSFENLMVSSAAETSSVSRATPSSTPSPPPTSRGDHHRMHGPSAFVQSATVGAVPFKMQQHHHQQQQGQVASASSLPQTASLYDMYQSSMQQFPAWRKTQTQSHRRQHTNDTAFLEERADHHTSSSPIEAIQQHLLKLIEEYNSLEHDGQNEDDVDGQGNAYTPVGKRNRREDTILAVLEQTRRAASNDDGTSPKIMSRGTVVGGVGEKEETNGKSSRSHNKLSNSSSPNQGVWEYGFAEMRVAHPALFKAISM